MEWTANMMMSMVVTQRGASCNAATAILVIVVMVMMTETRS